MSTPTPTALLITLLLFLLLTTLTLTNLIITRLYRILTRSKPQSQASSPVEHTSKRKGHLLILLGSGGHTTEMLSVLRTLGPEYLDTRFNRRTWVVSSGDGFSAARADEFEAELEKVRGGNGTADGDRSEGVQWDIVTVRRARKVHQSLFTTPVSALGCLVDCLLVLRGRGGQDKEPYAGGGGVKGQKSISADTNNYKSTSPYPDLILTNGPGTGVIMVLASLILLFLGLAPVSLRVKHTNTNTNNHNTIQTSKTGYVTGNNGRTQADREPQTQRETETETETEIGSMRSIYIESWARVKKLSLSGRIMRFLASRVLVQWRGLGEVDGTVVGGGVSGEGEGGLGGRGTKRSMRVPRREEGGESSGSGGGSSSSTIWPRRTEYIGAVVT